MSDVTDFTLKNARIILKDNMIEGWITIADGKVAEIGDGTTAPGCAMDMQGDYIIPGLIELHTDHLEPHFEPRAKVQWNALAAVLSYDAQIAASGITTVFDSLRVGAAADMDSISDEVLVLADAIERAQANNILRSEHRTHLRCEIATHNVVADVEAFIKSRPVHMISMMDHTPGQRQFRDLDKMKNYYTRHNFVEAHGFEAFVEARLKLHDRYAIPNRRALVAMANGHHVALASHDDATIEQVEEAIGDKVAIAEFPTTLEAAAASHAAGIHVMMGAPNVVRGGSHSGNVAAQDLAEAGLLDILSSDYVPSSLLLAAFDLPRRVKSYDLPHAIRLVSANPAKATGLDDRGEIAIGKRADLVRVAEICDVPVVRTVWRQGNRVI